MGEFEQAVRRWAPGLTGPRRDSVIEDRHVPFLETITAALSAADVWRRAPVQPQLRGGCRDEPAEDRRPAGLTVTASAGGDVRHLPIVQPRIRRGRVEDPAIVGGGSSHVSSWGW